MSSTAACDVVVAGGGTAGCVLAARLSEDPARTVCLVEAGPDYGPFAEGRWPVDIADAGRLAHSHDWGTGGEDQRSLGARIIGGCSSHNACMIMRGPPADYDAWGPGWTYAELAPFLERARAELRTGPANTERPAPLHVAFLEAAHTVGLPTLTPEVFDDGVGVSPFPANAVDGVRWNTAFAYLDAARGRPNLGVLADALVDRVVLDGTRAVGLLLQDGRQV